MRLHPSRALPAGPAAALLVTVAVAGCVTQPTPSSPSEPWQRDGAQVGIDVISSHHGDRHCGWEQARFLTLGFPIHLAPAGGPRTAQYARDPEGVLSRPEVRSAFRSGITLPADAKDTGYERDGTALWLADSDGASTAYLVTGDLVEAWPRVEPALGCD